MDTGSSHGRMTTVMVDTDHLALRTQVLGALPIIDHFLERLGVMEVLERYLAPSDRRLRLPAAKALGVLVCNLVIHKEPVYALGEWARAFDPSVFGVRGEEIRLLNDDRLGRALDRLFDADRATLLTELVVGAIDRFGIDCTQLHNDSTTVTFSGDYRFATGRPRGGKPTPAIDQGHNKGYRPDLNQLLWFLTLLQRGRREEAYLREWLQTPTPPWSEILRRPGPRKGEPDEVWTSTPSPIPSVEGYRIVWIWSSSKAQADASWRQGRIEAGCAALEA